METTLDLKTLWLMAIKHIKLIISITLIATFIAFLFTAIFITPKYTSEALLYIESKQNTTESISINDLTTAQKLVNTCVIIFKNDVVLDKVIKSLHLNYSTSGLKQMISLSAVNNTEVLRISAEGPDAQEVTAIVNQLIKIAPEEFLRVVKSGNIELISPASSSNQPSSPNTKLNIVIGFMLGLAISIMLTLLLEMLDTTVKADDDLYKQYNIPVFSEVMDFDAKVKGEYK